MRASPRLRTNELRKIENKKVYELQPDIDWNKGRALIWLLESLGLDRKEVFPIYIGDDRTDEDAFGAIRQRGAGILVSEQRPLTAARYALKNPSRFMILRSTEARSSSCSASPQI